MNFFKNLFVVTFHWLRDVVIGLSVLIAVAVLMGLCYLGLALDIGVLFLLLATVPWIAWIRSASDWSTSTTLRWVVFCGSLLVVITSWCANGLFPVWIGAIAVVILAACYGIWLLRQGNQSLAQWIVLATITLCGGHLMLGHATDAATSAALGLLLSSALWIAKLSNCGKAQLIQLDAGRADAMKLLFAGFIIAALILLGALFGTHTRVEQISYQLLRPILPATAWLAGVFGWPSHLGFYLLLGSIGAWFYGSLLVALAYGQNLLSPNPNRGPTESPGRMVAGAV